MTVGEMQARMSNLEWRKWVVVYQRRQQREELEEAKRKGAKR